jgi:AraC-like DNA-binding protein
MTFRRYRREVRIAAVVSLLGDNATPVKLIAGIAGYGDVSNFHRDFRQVQGMSPRQWRLMEFSRRSQSFETTEGTNSAVIVVPDDQAA